MQDENMYEREARQLRALIGFARLQLESADEFDYDECRFWIHEIDRNESFLRLAEENAREMKSPLRY